MAMEYIWGEPCLKHLIVHYFPAPKMKILWILGSFNQDGTVLGTYLHGFMDNNFFRQSLLCYIKVHWFINKPSNYFDFTVFRVFRVFRQSV